MPEFNLTPGAMRALEGAGRLAWAGGVSAVEPIHLLWALAFDESRASKLLRQNGVLIERIESSFSIASRVTEANTEAPPVPIPLSPALSQTIAEARTAVLHSGDDTDVGSEHLLAALAVVDVAIGKFLDEFGLGSQNLDTKFKQQAGIPTEPVPMDVAIRWQEPTDSDRTGTLRTLDAAANRAREGLRVVEDFVRFSLDDAHLSRLLKDLRHDLTERLGTLDRLGIVAARDTQHDVGTKIKTPREQTRQLPIDIVTANCRRVEEALRTLEEFSKLLIGTSFPSAESSQPRESPVADARLPSQLEQLRYQLYTIEQALSVTLASRERLTGCDLYLLATESLCHHGIGPAIRQALEFGVRIVQLREKEMTDRRLLEAAGRVRDWTREAGALFIMNDRADLAVLCDAEGVHVGQDELSVREARRIVGPQRLVGVSTHTIEQARQAVLDGADYIGVGPCFTSSTKNFEQLAGLDFVRQVAAEITLPWFAIGGVSLANLAAVRSAGASRVAVSEAICSSPTPGKTAAEFIDRLRSADK